MVYCLFCALISYFDFHFSCPLSLTSCLLVSQWFCDIKSTKLSACQVWLSCGKSLSSVVAAVGWSLHLHLASGTELSATKSINWALWCLGDGFKKLDTVLKPFQCISNRWTLHSKFNIVSGVGMQFTPWAWLSLIKLRRISYLTKLLSGLVQQSNNCSWGSPYVPYVTPHILSSHWLK